MPVNGKRGWIQEEDRRKAEEEDVTDKLLVEFVSSDTLMIGFDQIRRV